MRNDILDARESRYLYIQSLVTSNEWIIVVIKANIMGSNKSIKEAYHIVRLFKKILLQHFDVKEIIFFESHDGPYYICILEQYKVNHVKQVCISIEDHHELGRLVDLDVYDKNGSISRTSNHFSPRKCLICDDIAAHCIKHQKHKIDELINITQEKVNKNIKQTLYSIIASSMEMELVLEDKFGLVTKTSQGSHQDMNYHLMHSTFNVIIPYLVDLFMLGYQDLPDSLELARQIGIKAEQAMYIHTSGVNCYKGLIFILGGTLVGVGQVMKRNGLFDEIFFNIKQLYQPLMNDFNTISKTHGMEAYYRYGLLGARGELINGLPSIQTIYPNVPHSSKLNDGTLRYLLKELIVQCEDTTLLSRSKSLEQYLIVKKQFEQIDINNTEAVKKLSYQCISQGLSFGGAADLLITTICLKQIEELFF